MDTRKIKTTTQQPNWLAHLALEYQLHCFGVLRAELQRLLKGTTHNDIAMTFVSGVPVCVALYAPYGQLMVYTAPAYRRSGYGRRTIRLLSRSAGVKLNQMIGGIGAVSAISEAFFVGVGVPLCDDYQTAEN